LEQLKGLGLGSGVNYVFNCKEAHENFNQIVPTVGVFGKVLNITTFLPDKVNSAPLLARCATITWEYMMARYFFLYFLFHLFPIKNLSNWYSPLISDKYSK
jgi:hypothetical protein